MRPPETPPAPRGQQGPDPPRSQLGAGAVPGLETHSRGGSPKSQHARDRPQNPASSFPHPKFCSFTAPVHPPPPLSLLHHPRNSRGTPSKEPLDGAGRPSLVVPGGGQRWQQPETSPGRARWATKGDPSSPEPWHSRSLDPSPAGAAPLWIAARVERSHCGRTSGILPHSSGCQFGSWPAWKLPGAPNQSSPGPTSTSRVGLSELTCTSTAPGASRSSRTLRFGIFKGFC